MRITFEDITATDLMEFNELMLSLIKPKPEEKVEEVPKLRKKPGPKPKAEEEPKVEEAPKVRKKPGPKPKAKNEDEEQKKESKKARRYTPKEKLDRGRVMALHCGSWSVADIADDINAREIDVREIIREEQAGL